MGKDECEHMLIFTKIMKTSLYDSKNGKAAKIRTLIDKLQKTPIKGFTVVHLVKMDESFVTKLSS